MGIRGSAWLAGYILSFICPAFAPMFIMAVAMTAVTLTIGGTIAGIKSKRQGKSFWSGFDNYINHNWAQSLSISIAITMITFGISQAVQAIAKAGSRETFDVLKFDQRAVDIAKQGNPSYGTFKNRLFAAQERLHPKTFDALIPGKNPLINGQKVILHHPLGRTGANLYNVVGVTQSQHLAIHSIIGYQNANWAGVLYNLGSGAF